MRVLSIVQAESPGTRWPFTELPTIWRPADEHQGHTDGDDRGKRGQLEHLSLSNSPLVAMWAGTSTGETATDEATAPRYALRTDSAGGAARGGMKSVLGALKISEAP